MDTTFWPNVLDNLKWVSFKHSLSQDVCQVRIERLSSFSFALCAIDFTSPTTKGNLRSEIRKRAVLVSSSPSTTFLVYKGESEPGNFCRWSERDSAVSVSLWTFWNDLFSSSNASKVSKNAHSSETKRTSPISCQAQCGIQLITS